MSEKHTVERRPQLELYLAEYSKFNSVGTLIAEEAKECLSEMAIHYENSQTI